MAPTSITINFLIATSSMPMPTEPVDSDLCKCGHTRRAHERKRGRCSQQNWRDHRCNCSLFRRPQ